MAQPQALRQDQAFLYQRDDDGWLVTVRGDFAEMLHVSPSSCRSLYERYEASTEKIRLAIKELQAEGYKLSYSIDLKLKTLVEA
jgi:hypothetical protein